MAVKLIDEGFEIEAYCLILATWNFGTFFYNLKKIDIKEFDKKIKKLNSCFDKMENEDFKTINFDNYEEEIKEIFKTLSNIEFIKFTGASKVMHLRNRSVFVMWDRYISGNRSRKYYNKKILKQCCWIPEKYGQNEEGYFKFLKYMQRLFKNINFRDDKKTFAKAIDEYNYVEITLHIQKKEKDNKREKKKRDGK
jgi:hypothetical protein